MKLKNLFLIAIIAAMWHSAALGQDSDTLWTQNLWKLGSQINQVQFLPDGQHLAVCIGGGVYIFNIQTKLIEKQFNKYMLLCRGFTFSEDGTKLITTSDEDWDQGYKIIVWDYNTGDTIKVIKDIVIAKIKLYNDHTITGLSAFIEPENKLYMYFVDINSGTIISKKELQDAESYAVSIVNNKIATLDYGNGKRYVQIRDLTTFEILSTLGYHEASTLDLSFSSDGKYLASASSDGVIKVWDLDTKTLYKTFIHQSMYNGYIQIKFSPNGGYLVSSGGNGSDFNTKIWDMKNFEINHTYPTPLGAQYALTVSEDSSFIVAGRARTLIVLNSKWTQTGITTPNQEYQILYPNPAGNEIIIPIFEGLLPTKVNIFDTLGQTINVINQVDLSGNIIKLDIRSILPGNYFISVIYQSKILSYKFEKVR